MASFVRMAGGATILMALVAVGDASSCVIQAGDIRVEGLAQRTPSDVVAVGTATPSLSWVVSEQDGSLEQLALCMPLLSVMKMVGRCQGVGSVDAVVVL